MVHLKHIKYELHSWSTFYFKFLYSWKGEIKQKQNSTSATCNWMKQCNCLITEYAISDFSRKEKWICNIVTGYYII